MKQSYIADLQPKQQVATVFLVQAKDIRQKKSGEPYLSLVLVDRSGEIDAKMWDNVGDVMDTFERDDFLKIKGETQIFQNRLQLTIHKLVKVADQEVDLGDFLPVSKRPPQEMWDELMALVANLQNPHLKALLESILSDPTIGPAFLRAPAAKGIHHAWLGGLLEHVLSLARLGRTMVKHYDAIDEDLLMTGVVLHDLGKITELSYERSFSYTTEGQLLGHMQIAMRIIADHVHKVPGFPAKLRTLLEHMILSHHGQLEFGSPKLPQFPEALLLHLLDNLDSKMETMRASLARDRQSVTEWTSYNHALDRSILDKHKYLNPPMPAVAVPVPSGSVPVASASSPAARIAQKSASLFGEQLTAAWSSKDSPKETQ